MSFLTHLSRTSW